MKITEHFDSQEFEVTDLKEYSNYNKLTPEALENVRALCLNVLEPLRKVWGEPLTINSGYRSDKLNRAVGGVPTSQHCKGMAADVCPSPRRNAKFSSRTIIDLAQKAINKGIKFDQMILYPNFLHISFDRTKAQQRGELLYSNAWVKHYAARL